MPEFDKWINKHNAYKLAARSPGFEIFLREAFEAALEIEREKCARVCETINKEIVCPEECAAAIRKCNTARKHLMRVED